MAIKIGTKVKLTQAVENYPTICAPAGLTGILTRIDNDGAYWVKLDKHFDELKEWDNELQIWDWSQDNSPDHHPEKYITAI